MWPAAQCTTFTNDTGTCTPAGVKKAVTLFTNDYAPTKTGGGASGDWGINITGNAATATTLSATLAVNKGGTGKTTHTSNAILTGNGTSAVKNVATANGAFYATSANGAATFGTLPIEQGGTGANNRYEAVNNIFAHPHNPINSVANDTPSNWGTTIGTGFSHFWERRLNNQPSDYGNILTLSPIWSQDVTQIWQELPSGTMYIRGGNSSGWHEWKKVFDNTQIIPVANGGTGSTTTSGARTNLDICGYVRYGTLSSRPETANPGDIYFSIG